MKRFLIVDDDLVNNLLSKTMLKKSFGEVEITEFLVPEAGLDFIESQFNYNPNDEKTTLFLDINMPSMSGWEFLEKFQKFKESLKEQFNIYVLSSSVDERDIKRANLNSLVLEYIEKPLSRRTLLKIFS